MNTVDRCYVLTRHMLTDPLKDIALHLNKDAQQAHALDLGAAAPRRGRPPPRGRGAVTLGLAFARGEVTLDQVLELRRPARPEVTRG